ncbi:hypothetical protein EON65_06015 [archaeon]|nr:MAG: hypothetical protein EON65_06015 [archaeon]
MIIGYVFYLVISLFNGELLVNTADFMKEYVPAVELWLISQFPTLETRNSRESEMGTKHSNTSKKDRAGGTALFDDRTSSVGHIVSGDMAMTSHSFPTTYDSTGHTDFADFGTGQNEGAVNALHQENRNFSI